VTEKERTRTLPGRLAILRHAEKVTGNVALTCRCYGITRQAFYQSRRRNETRGLETLQDLRSARRTPGPGTGRAAQDLNEPAQPVCAIPALAALAASCR
jgi:hypothetical protein